MKSSESSQSRFLLQSILKIKREFRVLFNVLQNEKIDIQEYPRFGEEIASKIEAKSIEIKEKLLKECLRGIGKRKVSIRYQIEEGMKHIYYSLGADEESQMKILKELFGFSDNKQSEYPEDAFPWSYNDKKVQIDLIEGNYCCM